MDELEKLFFAPEFLDTGRIPTDVEQDLDHPLSKGLVGRWLCNGRGDTEFDITGNKNHGALIGGVTRTVYPAIGETVDFDGNDNYIDLGAGLNGVLSQKSFTISYWAIAGTAGHSDFTITCQEPGFQDEVRGAVLSTGEAHFSYDDAAVGAVNVNGITDIRTKLHLVTITADSNTLRLYVDDAEEDSSNISGSGVLNLTDTTVVATRLASSVPPAPGSSSYYLGKISDLRIYDRALEPSEIRQIFVNPSQDLKPRSVWLPAKAPVGLTAGSLSLMGVGT